MEFVHLPVIRVSVRVGHGYTHLLPRRQHLQQEQADTATHQDMVSRTVDLSLLSSRYYGYLTIEKQNTHTHS